MIKQTVICDHCKQNFDCDSENLKQYFIQDEAFIGRIYPKSGMFRVDLCEKCAEEWLNFVGKSDKK